MCKGLAFIQSCVRQGINTDDLGYITKDYINNLDDIDNFFQHVKDRITTKFFDQPNSISRILNLHNAT